MMYLPSLFLDAAILLFFVVFMYNDLSSIATKTELTGTETLFTVFMKLFV